MENKTDSKTKIIKPRKAFDKIKNMDKVTSINIKLNACIPIKKINTNVSINKKSPKTCIPKIKRTITDGTKKNIEYYGDNSPTIKSKKLARLKKYNHIPLT